jgi:hypothetical protein
LARAAQERKKRKKRALQNQAKNVVSSTGKGTYIGFFEVEHNGMKKEHSSGPHVPICLQY